MNYIKSRSTLFAQDTDCIDDDIDSAQARQPVFRPDIARVIDRQFGRPTDASDTANNLMSGYGQFRAKMASDETIGAANQYFYTVISIKTEIGG